MIIVILNQIKGSKNDEKEKDQKVHQKRDGQQTSQRVKARDQEAYQRL